MDRLGPASPTIDVTLFNIIRKAEEFDDAIKFIIDQNWSGYSGLLTKDYFPDVCGDWDAEVDFAYAVIGILDALDAAGAPERQRWDPLHRAQIKEFEESIRHFLKRIGWEWTLQPGRREYASTRANKFKYEIENPLLESALVLYRYSEDLAIIKSVRSEAELAIEREIDAKMTLEGARTTYAELIHRQQQGQLSIFRDNRVETSSAYFRSLSLSIESLGNFLATSPETVDRPLPHADDQGIKDDQEQARVERLGQERQGKRELWVTTNDAHADARKLGLDWTDQRFWAAAREGQFEQKKNLNKFSYEYGSFMRWVKLRLQDGRQS